MVAGRTADAFSARVEVRDGDGTRVRLALCWECAAVQVCLGARDAVSLAETVDVDVWRRSGGRAGMRVPVALMLIAARDSVALGLRPTAPVSVAEPPRVAVDAAVIVAAPDAVAVGVRG